MQLRIAPLGVSCLLTINLYGGLFYGVASMMKLPVKLSIAPFLQPILVALLSFLTVFVDLSMGREAENMSEIMQEVCQSPNSICNLLSLLHGNYLLFPLSHKLWHAWRPVEWQHNVHNLLCDCWGCVWDESVS